MEYLECDCRILNIQNVEKLQVLIDEVEWPFPKNYLKILLATGRIFGLYTAENELAATAAVFNYGDSFSLMGLIIVRKKFRGQGLATRIMDIAEKQLFAKSSSSILVATPVGQPVYERRGYKVIGECLKLVRRDKTSMQEYPSLPQLRFKPLQDGNRKALAKLDLAAFGADRSHVLTALLASKTSSVAIFDEEIEELVSYAFGAKRKKMMVIGPVVAEEASHAIAMVQMLSYGWKGPIRIDIPSSQAGFKDELLKLKFEVDEVAPIMQLGTGGDYMNRPNIFALTSQALG